jgi:hypothetical protein
MANNVIPFAQEATGITPPRSFILDASVLEEQDIQKITSDDIKQNRVEFVFPDGLAEVDLLEECRALTSLDDFDTMYDITMQFLTGKSLVVNIKNEDGSRSVLCKFQVTSKEMNLRSIDAIAESPVVIVWLVEFMAAYLSKKRPTLKRKPLPGVSEGKKRQGEAETAGS